MEYLKDYDFKLLYHLGKANVVADTLSRKKMHMLCMMIKELELIENSEIWIWECSLGKTPYNATNLLKVTNEFLNEICVAQGHDLELQ